MGTERKVRFEVVGPLCTCAACGAETPYFDYRDRAFIQSVTRCQACNALLLVTFEPPVRSAVLTLGTRKVRPGMSAYRAWNDWVYTAS